MLEKFYLLSITGHRRKKRNNIFNIKKVDGFVKNKTNNALQVYETFYNKKPFDFIGDLCTEAGLNKGILDIF